MSVTKRWFPKSFTTATAELLARRIAANIAKLPELLPQRANNPPPRHYRSCSAASTKESRLLSTPLLLRRIVIRSAYAPIAYAFFQRQASQLRELGATNFGLGLSGPFFLACAVAAARA